MTAPSRDLVALPAHPAGVPWPTDEWPRGDVPAGVDLDALLDDLFDADGHLRTTYAAVVIHRGRLIAERYDQSIEHFDRPAEVVGSTTPLLSWSMAKSMLHAVVGMLVADGRLSLDAPVDVPEWSGATDGRETITLEHLLDMRDGLDFVEDYVDDKVSDVIEMLFASGAKDVAHFAAERGLAAPPGTLFNYSSGTTNIISGIVARLLGPGAPYERFLQERLFRPIGMRTAEPRFDDAGTWIASSYVHCAAQDFARFGYLYMRDGSWDGQRILPEGWVDHARRIRSVDATTEALYGAHWWCLGDEYGTFRCSGYEGQVIWCVPALDLVLVRLGKTEAERGPLLLDWHRRVTNAFAAAAS